MNISSPNSLFATDINTEFWYIYNGLNPHKSACIIYMIH